MGKHLFLLAGVLLSALSLCAQFETSEVLGTITDSSGAVIPKVAVTLLNQDTGIEAKTFSDESGQYDFFNVRIGRYTISAELTGFSKYSTQNVTVNVNARQRVDVVMQVGGVSQAVNVQDAAEVLDTDSSEKGQVIHTQQIVELPLNGRNFSDLALLATNVHRSPLAAGLQSTPREGAFNANGMRSTYNNFLLDGLDNNVYSTSNQGFSNQVAQPSPDAIAEFKVITSNFSAEYGRVGGAVVNSVMRSGTNAVHGSAYDFLRNTDLNAIGYIFGQRASTFQKPSLQRNQFGFTVGGPIIKNRLFFFADYEGFRSLQRSLNYDSVPSLSERTGTLLQTVFDPNNGVTYQKGTAIPASAISPFASQVLNALPAPNLAGRSNNYAALLLTRDYYDKYDGKIDGQINSKMTGFLRWSQRKDNQFYQPDLSGPSGGNGNGNVRILDQAAAAGYTWTVTPTSLFEARLGFTHVLGGKFPVFLGGASVGTLYGVQNVPQSPDFSGGLNTQSVSGYSTFGRQATNPQFQNPTTWNPKFNYAASFGRHALKAGYEFTTIHTEVMDINPVYGLNNYAGQFSKPSSTSPADATTYNLADFLFGLPSQVQIANYLITNYRQHQHFAYVQDDYRVNSKLTIDLGIRWEYATPRWERDNNLTNYNPATNSLVKATSGSLLNRTGVNPDYHDFAPRVGFAYSLVTKTVVRGGYGISYVHLNRLGSADELGINGPQVNIATYNQTLAASTLVPASFIHSNAFPANASSPGNFNAVNANVAYIPADTRWPMVQSWFFGIQQELAKSTILELAYNGNHSTRLPVVADYNQAFPNLPGQALGIQARRPNQFFGAITWVDPAGQSSYNGLSARLEHRFSAGLYLLNSFTWGKALGNSEQALETLPGASVANPQNIRNLAAERGPSSFDTKFINVTSLVYQVPFGKHRTFGSHWNSAVDCVLGGWELNSINTWNTGLPINVIYNPTAANDPTGRIADYRGAAILRPNIIGDPTGSSGGAAMVDNYFDKAAFTIPVASAPFGNLSRNAFRGPNFNQWDLGVNKSFSLPFREGMAVQIRSEFFNVLNHTNFGYPDAIVTDAAFGTIRSTFPPRQIQFALKLLF